MHNLTLIKYFFGIRLVILLPGKNTVFEKRGTIRPIDGLDYSLKALNNSFVNFNKICQLILRGRRDFTSEFGFLYVQGVSQENGNLNTRLNFRSLCILTSYGKYPSV